MPEKVAERSVQYEELTQHKTKDDCWMAIHGKVCPVLLLLAAQPLATGSAPIAQQHLRGPEPASHLFFLALYSRVISAWQHGGQGQSCDSTVGIE